VFNAANVRALQAPASWISSRGAAIASLEDPLLRRSLGFPFTGLLLAASLPFLVVFWLIDRAGMRVAAVSRQVRHRRKAGSSALPSSWTENEFQFADAIEEYEKLIDATARRRG
jgi:hypothetical protein